METTLAAEPVSVTAAPVGELADFDAVVRDHQPAIFRFVLVSLREREPAENLTQECFLRAYQARRSFRGDASVRTWLMRIAVNLVNDHRKSARLRFWRRAAQTSLDVTFTGDWLADPRSSPEAEASAREQVKAVWRATAALSERQRTVFLLRFVEEMEIREIAAAVGLREGTVKAHLFRAVDAVRKKLRETP
ncbi:MAG: sigma-70 family RNA polymerase sigma factor [Bryobacteraceae bacterium]|jgi:RNA polymerase sigma-70 factor (ECF subfamily)